MSLFIYLSFQDLFDILCQKQSSFLQILKNNEEYEYDLDWDKMELTTKVPVEHILSDFVVYMNKEYFNDALVTLDNAKKKRIQATTVTDNNAGIDPFK